MSSATLLYFFVMVSGPAITVSSSNWVICWVGVEIGFIGLIPLLFLSVPYFSLTKESSMKYFCVQALGSGILLLSGLLVYGTDHDIGWSVGDNLAISMILLLSLFIKVGAYPTHFWVLGVVTGLDWVPMFLILAWQKVAPFCLLLKLIETNSSLVYPVLILGGITSLVGAIIGLNQTNFRGMLGASSISHTGWGLLAVCFGSFWLYFVLYCLSFLLVLFCMSSEMGPLGGLTVLSLSGLPPFVLFMGKWKVLLAGIMSGHHVFYFVFPLLGALLSLFFYLKFLCSFYLGEKFYLSPKTLILAIVLFVFNFVGSIYVLLIY